MFTFTNFTDTAGLEGYAETQVQSMKKVAILIVVFTDVNQVVTCMNAKVFGEPGSCSNCPLHCEDAGVPFGGSCSGT